MNDKSTILIVDDHLSAREVLRGLLTKEDYNLVFACNGLEALKVLQSQSVNLIITDIAMPDMNGYQLYERVCDNPEWVTIPFIFLTARTMDSDIRYGKELGVDDYLTKPIRAADLLAVVRGKLKRAQQVAESTAPLTPSPTTETGVLTVGPLQIDSSQYRAWLNEQELKLSAKEFALLEYLARQAGKVVSPQELIQVTHDLDTDHIEAGTLLRPLILSLRRKLNLPLGQIASIENVRGIGYRLVVSN
jgi:DNA-binding response OmpR family regulator